MPNMIVSTIVVLIILLCSVILHEFSHGLVAYWLGDNTAKDAGRLTLNPFKHIDPVLSIIVPLLLFLIGAPVFGAAKPVPINKDNVKWGVWGMALVAIAGPLTNFLIALIAFLIGHFFGFLDGGAGEFWYFTFQEIVLINLGFMIFNLIPIPPTDGSRVLYAIAPDGVRNVMTAIERYGGVFLLFILVFFFSNVFSNIISSGTQGILNFFHWLVGG